MATITFDISSDAALGATALSNAPSASTSAGQGLPAVGEDSMVIISMKGDVNGDGKVRSNDAIKVLRFSAGLEVPTPEQECAADMNNDGQVRSNDAIAIIRKSAGIDNAAPASQ